MLAVRETGAPDGPAIVFLHAAGISSWMWHEVVRRLPACRCLLVDLPGHGESGAVPWVSLSKTAEAVADAVLDRAGAQGTHLAGLSLGSYVGLTLLARHPTAFESALLSGMHGGGMPRQWLMKLMMTAMAPIATRPFMARKTARMMAGAGVDTERFVAEAGKTRTGALMRAVNQVIAFEPPEGLDRISTRTLFVAGDQEVPLIRATGPVLARALPRGRYVAIPDAHHGWPGRKPDLCAEMVRAQVTNRPSPVPGAPV